jgi:hypothetical protein
MSGMLQLSEQEMQEILGAREHQARIQSERDANQLYRTDSLEQSVDAFKRLWRILNGERPTRDIAHHRPGMLPLVPPEPPKPVPPHEKRYPPILGTRG